MEKNIGKTVEEILSRGVAEVIDREGLKKRLISGPKMRVKLGIDPTSPYLHLGRAVTLLKLRDLQQLGHQVVFIIGDFTGIIGDTSDKESERPMLSQEVVKKNMDSYISQIGKILDIDKVEKHYNSEWLSKMGYMEIGEQADQFSLAEFTSREIIKNRLTSGTRISLREVLYPLMQGYDSVMVKADLELGGTDQRFNLLAGRELQKHYGQEPQNILMVNLIEGTDGRKMSSSWGNTVNIIDEPNNMFGKVMSIPDSLIIKYFVHCTRVPIDDIKKMEQDIQSEKTNPRDLKIQLASEIVKIYHSDKEAVAAQKYFIDTFSKKEIPTEVPEVSISEKGIKITEFLVYSGQAKSLSDARRKIEQGAVEVDGKKIQDWNMILNEKYSGNVFKIGKHGFARLIIKI